MADYRLPMDADGVKYHGTVDQNEENPGQFMYGLDENGNKRIIRTDEQGNVLTRVTGSNVEVIKEYMAEPVLNTRNFFVGDFITDNVSSLRGVNVSHYSMISIFIRNNTPEEVLINNAYFGTERNVPDEGGSLTERSEERRVGKECRCQRVRDRRERKRRTKVDVR